MRARIVLVLSLATAAAAAQPPAPDRIELGGGTSVQRVVRPCWYDVAVTCSWWVPGGGLSFGDVPDLEVAIAWGRAPSGRIFAMTPGALGGTPVVLGTARYALTAAVLFTDDLGATWRRASWPDPHAHARAFAFDPRTGDAVAVGVSGIWSSDDQGVTWRRRRSTSGTIYVAAWLRGRTLVVQDDRGALWLSRDGGFRLESLADRGSAIERGDEIVITADDRAMRLDARGGLHRE